MSIVKRFTKGGILLLASGWLGTLPLASAHATDVSYGGWLDSVKFGGDLRLRHDTLFKTSNTANEDRERFRLRYGLTAKAGDIDAIFRLSSGSGDQDSANQTEQTSFTRKSILIDLAYLKYRPFEVFTAMGGKMDNPFWHGWSSSLVFDPDLNPEGYAEKLDLPMGVFATFGQFAINENSSFNEANPWMLSEQLGIKGSLPGDVNGTLSVADYGFTNETTQAFGGSAKQGNTVSGGVRTSSFNILHLDGKLNFRAGDLPLLLEGGFVSNTQESKHVGRDGHIFGLTAGKASKANTWEAAYYYKSLGANAVVSDFVDDDFGPGGTNLAGHIFWLAYNPRENLQLKATYYNTHFLDMTLTSSPRYTSHMMLDVIVKI